MDKIRVAHSSVIWLVQTETFLFNQFKHLDDTIEPHVICYRLENLDQFYIENISQIPAPLGFEKYYDKFLRTLRINAYSRPFLKQLMKVKPMILHSHFGHRGWVELAAAKKARLKHIVTFYGGGDVNLLPVIEPAWKKRYRKLFKHVNLVLCEGPFMAQSVIDLGCPSYKVKVHHLGIPVNEIPFKPRIWDQNQTLRVLIAASFQERKGIPYALEALARIRHLVPLEITIIGDANEQTRSQIEKRKILKTIESCKLNGSIRLLGYQPYNVLLKESYGHHIFISPSVTASDGDAEGGAPVTLIEMAASGIPIVSSKHCDITEIIHHGVTGFLAEERDVQGLVDNLIWLVDNSDKWVDFLEKARKHIEKRFSAKTQGSKLSKIYKEILEE